ncbi:ParA family protein [Streptomyces sp. NPDC052000]|uniref:ParA family protein n=1 Tax=Streptomyces sp. NPDC052000 TaxID=3155676 RepID=UPI00344F0327
MTLSQLTGEEVAIFRLWMAQAVTHWLGQHPSPGARLLTQPVKRILVALQKGGVSKSFVAAGLAQAFAELGLSVLLIDYDPQGHMTRRLGQKLIPMDSGSSLPEPCSARLGATSGGPS